jgi:hypothetical protein
MHSLSSHGIAGSAAEFQIFQKSGTIEWAVSYFLNIFTNRNITKATTATTIKMPDHTPASNILPTNSQLEKRVIMANKLRIEKSWIFMIFIIIGLKLFLDAMGQYLLDL